WTQFGSRCFAFYIQTKTWIDTFCQTAGGNLASIHSDTEHAFLKAFIFQETGTQRTSWIGGTDAGTWLWSDGSKFNYKSWNAGEPNNAGGENSNWNDWACTNQASFVCSKNL
uniref:C-type lectin domain-containing protein n=1 Tax=Sander lucioperca TaxID=283035 RepID=A0A8D0AG48_SANLU